MRLHPAAWWGLAGLTLILTNPILRLLPRALEPVETGMTAVEWGLWLGSCISFAYAEGYRGFHQRFSPRVAARATVITQGGSVVRYLFAPFFLMGLFHATRRRMITSWTLLTVILLLIIGVRLLPQPWRGIVDAGVVVGLSIGLASVWWAVARVLRGGEPVDPELGVGSE